jgi:UDP-arabinose 4-epimerase
MSILVTGGAGFVGSHAVKALRRSARAVVVLDNLASGNAESVAGGPLVVGDICQPGLVAEICAAHHVTAIVHFGAVLSVPQSMQAPALYYRTNVAGTLSVLEAAAASGVRAFLLASSASIYGEGAGRPFTEADPPLPMNPYGATKLVAERALPYFEAAYGIRWAAVRIFNAAGADPDGEIGEVHAPETHLIAEMVACAADGLPCDLHGGDYATGDGTCVRDYVHVSDVAQACVLALDRLERGGPSGCYNVGSGRGDSVLDVKRAVESVTGRRLLTRIGPRRRGDPASLIACCDRIARDLGWRARCSDLHTIAATAFAWYTGATRRTWQRVLQAEQV